MKDVKLKTTDNQELETLVPIDRAVCLRSPDDVEFYYFMLSSNTGFVRCALIDS